MLTAGGILKGAFRLLRDQPKAVAAWCLLETAATALLTLAMRPLAQMQDDSGAQVAITHAAGLVGWLIAGELAAFLVYAVVITAAMRAVLRPREERAAYLRLGLDELRLFGLGLLWVILLYLGITVGTALFAVIGAWVGRAGGFSDFMAVVGIGFVIMLCGAVWLQMRLGLAFPLTVLRRRFVIGESWGLTRGHFWRLLGASLVIFLLLLALFILVAAVTQGSYWAEVMRSGFGSYEARQASARQAAAGLALSPATAINWLVSGIVMGLTAALLGAATASAARLLTDDTDRIAETFA